MSVPIDVPLDDETVPLLMAPDVPEAGSVLDHALAYADAGFEAMPRYGKHKLIDAISGSPRSGIRGRGPITSYFTEFPDTGAIAVVCGRNSNILVVDLDRNHKDGADGLATWRAWEAAYGPVTAPFVITPSGGRHLYFRWPGLRLKNGPIAPGVEILGERMAANLPPSKKAGAPYRWSLMRHPNWLPMPLPPKWLTDMATVKPPKRTNTRQREVSDRYVAKALEGLASDVASACTNRNQTLYRSAARCMDFVRQGKLHSQNIEERLLPAALSAGLSTTEAMTTINSARGKLSG